jgi:FkbM family methyltransferase
LQTDVGRLLLPERDKVMLPWIASRGTWEPEAGEFMRQHLRPGMSVLDIGAHCGYSTLLAAQLVGPSGSVIAVEAEPRNHALLRENVSHARLRNVRVVHAAAWRESGTIPLSVSDSNSGDRRAYVIDGGSETIDVPAVALDELKPPPTTLDFVKLGAQGTEHVALEGMRETIARFHPVVLVHFWPAAIRDAGDDPADVLAMYRELGYEMTPLSDRESGAGLTSEQLIEMTEAKGFDSLILHQGQTLSPPRPRSAGAAPVAPGAEPSAGMLSPLLVVSPGRSGSTLVMRFLASSPQIGMERASPFEALYFQYFLRLSQLIDSPSLPHWERSQFVGQMRDPRVSDGLVGPPPWPDKLRTVEKLGDTSLGERMLMASWREFSAQARLRDPGAIWWAEKAGVSSHVQSGGPLGIRLLFLVRDPRDVLLSWGAFDQARGPEVVASRPFTRTVEGAARGSRRFLTRAREGFHVRYEDAISDPDGVARSISEWLGTEVTAPAEVDEKHLTSENPAQSVGRWEREMDDETQALYARELGPLLSEFGYRV